MSRPESATRAEIAANYDFFQRQLGQLLADHAGQFALLRGRRIIGYFDDPFDADLAGTHAFPDKLYSIQQVTSEPAELGIYANAAH
jgi:hypothetical protein